MKFLTPIFALLLIFSLETTAQTPWPEKGTLWWYIGGDAVSGPQLLFLEATGETVFKGKRSQKVIRRDIDFEGNSTVKGQFFLYQQNDSVFYYSDVWDDYILIFDLAAKDGDTLTLKNPITKSGPDSILVSLTKGENDPKRQGGISAYQEELMKLCLIRPLDDYAWYGFDESDQLFQNFGQNAPGVYGENTSYDGLLSIASDVGLISDVIVFPSPLLDQMWINIQVGFRNEQLDFKITNAVGRQVVRGRLNHPTTMVSVERLPPGKYYLHFPDSPFRPKEFDVW